MANATPSRYGQINGAGAVDAIFLKVFAGEVLTAYDKNITLRERTRRRLIDSGKSAAFPTTYVASGGYHTAGAEIVGRPILSNEVVITVDDPLISDVFISNIDEAKAHYDVRGPYSTEQGRYLARQEDKNIARSIHLAANSAALHTGDTGGQNVVSANSKVSATALASALWASKQLLDNADSLSSGEPVYAPLLPAQWYLMAQEVSILVNRDHNPNANYAAGTLDLIGGIELLKSNNYPWGVNESADATIFNTSLRRNMTNTTTCVFTPDAAATVQLMGLALEAGYDMRRQGTLLIAKYALGHGSLIPKASVEIKTA